MKGKWMATRRTLKDLYVRGKLITVDDGEGPVEVWVQKMNPVQYSICLKKADAARARILTALRDKESEDYLAAVADLLGADKEGLIAFLAAVERGRLSPLVDAQVSSEEKWTADNYLSGLKAAWEDLEAVFVDDPEDKEATRVKAALDEFVHQCETELDGQVEAFEDALGGVPEEELIEMATTHQLKILGEMYWMNEFYIQEVLFGVRDPEDHSVRLYEDRKELEELQGETYGALSNAVREVAVDPIEGKESAGRPPSSPSSEQSGQEAT